MAFSEAEISAVWAKGQIVANNDPNLWRMDECGAWISRGAYGNRNSQYGWEIDHITPVSRGGGDELSNLRPLQWQNNVYRQDGQLDRYLTASGVNNVLTRKVSSLW